MKHLVVLLNWLHIQLRLTLLVLKAVILYFVFLNQLRKIQVRQLNHLLIFIL
nr:MAG TPA: hypothetical protein [Caudoviricetes sp.]